jgi:hypothetical protein
MPEYAPADAFLRPGANVLDPDLAPTDALLVTFGPDLGGLPPIIETGDTSSRAVLEGARVAVAAVGDTASTVELEAPTFGDVRVRSVHGALEALVAAGDTSSRLVDAGVVFGPPGSTVTIVAGVITPVTIGDTALLDPAGTLEATPAGRRDRVRPGVGHARIRAGRITRQAAGELASASAGAVTIPDTGTINPTPPGVVEEE